MSLTVLGPNVTCRVDVYRKTPARHGTGVTTTSWLRDTRNLRVALQKVSGGQAVRYFGRDSTSRWHMVTDPDADVQNDDVIVVIDGPDEGERIEVVDVLKGRGRLKAVELRNTDVDPVS
jgi:hypothetical protein